jgi:DNA-binding NarL/FixJ family response regulator
MRLRENSLKVRTVICGGNPLVRAGIRATLNEAADMELVAEVSRGASLRQVALLCRPDVIVLDDGCDIGEDGVELARQLLTAYLYPLAGMVVLTAEATVARIVDYLDAGVRGMVARDGSVEELLSAVRNVAQGEALISSGPAACVIGLLVDRTAAPSARPAPSLEKLTKREREIFELLNTGMPNAEIALRLSLSEKTVKFHVSNILRKLNLRNRVEAAIYGAGTYRQVC